MNHYKNQKLEHLQHMSDGTHMSIEARNKLDLTVQKEAQSILQNQELPRPK